MELNKETYAAFRKHLCWKVKTDGGRYYQDTMHIPPKNRKLRRGEQRITRRYLRIKGAVAKNQEILELATFLFGWDAIRIGTSREGLWNGEPEPILHITLPNKLIEERK